jgi:hypothetical protein
MDLFRTRAIPALIAALLATGAHAACEALNGTYRYEAGIVDMRARYLGDLTVGPERRKLMKTEGSPVKRDWTSSQPVSRGKVTILAATGKLATDARGAKIEFRDAHDKPLATLGIGEGWSCKAEALERDAQNTAGLGENIRTERTHERLSKSGKDLLYTETVTVIDPKGGKPKRTEIRFPAAS